MNSDTFFSRGGIWRKTFFFFRERAEWRDGKSFGSMDKRDNRRREKKKNMCVSFGSVNGAEFEVKKYIRRMLC